MSGNSHFALDKRRILRKVNSLSKTRQNELVKFVLKEDFVKKTQMNSHKVKQSPLSTIISFFLANLDIEDQKKLAEIISDYIGKDRKEQSKPIRLHTVTIEEDKKYTKRFVERFIESSAEKLIRSVELQQEIRRDMIQIILEYNGFTADIARSLSDLVLENTEDELDDSVDRIIDNLASEKLPKNIDPEYILELKETTKSFTRQISIISRKSSFLALSVANKLYKMSSSESGKHLYEIIKNNKGLDNDNENSILLNYIGFDEEAIHDLIILYTATVLKEWGFPTDMNELIKELEMYHYTRDESSLLLVINPFPWFR